MPKICNHTDCTYPVFSHLYCQKHQSSRQDAKWLYTLEKRKYPHKSNYKEQGITIIAKNKITPKKAYSIPKISKKKVEELKEYRIVRDAYFKLHPVCEYPNCNSQEVTLHHAAGRTGKLLTNSKYFKSLCMFHHEWAERNPVEAKELGLSVSRLDK